jgi:hypothetical protein
VGRWGETFPGAVFRKNQLLSRPASCLEDSLLLPGVGSYNGKAFDVPAKFKVHHAWSVDTYGGYACRPAPLLAACARQPSAPSPTLRLKSWARRTFIDVPGWMILSFTLTICAYITD